MPLTSTPWRARAGRTTLGYALACTLALTGCTNAGRIVRFAGGALLSVFETPAPVPNRLTVLPVENARLAVTWVGHATALVQMSDKFVVTDPVFTRSVGQLSTRLFEPGIAVEHLPRLDAAVVSHLHFDHLSLGSLDLIEDRVAALVLPWGGSVYVPRGKVLPTELGPYDSWEHDGLRITAVPVVHLGWRYGFDRDWMDRSYVGYVLDYAGVRVYFGGDTAYHPTLFKEVGQHLGPFDVALLPIAPIAPRDFMCRVHMDPAEALAAFEDLRADVLVPIHFDTFVNSLDELGDAVRELEQARLRRGLGPERLRVLALGERAVLSRQRLP